VLSVADKVIVAVKSGAIKHFFLVGGCDGAKRAEILYGFCETDTEGYDYINSCLCKFRFNDLNIGEIGGLPRIMDMGQCNDAYGADSGCARLAEAFGCKVNDLPLSLVLSWSEQ
jgi:hydroxylamine reductase